MSDEELKQKQELDAQMKARFEHLANQAKEASELEAKIKASYHHSKEQDLKDDRAQALASAEAERQDKPKLDPLELIRQVNRMREEGFDEGTIRAAFDEVMAEMTGNFRRPVRRVVRSADMVKMLSQPEINKMYEDQYREIEQDPPEHVKHIFEALDKSKQASEAILSYQKPTLKNYLYRGILKVIRRPVQFLINFLIAYRNAKHMTKSSYYEEKSDERQ